MPKYTNTEDGDMYMVEGARIVLNTLYNMGYEFPEDHYSEFLKDVRRQLNDDFPPFMRRPLKILKDLRDKGGAADE